MWGLALVLACWHCLEQRDFDSHWGPLVSMRWNYIVTCQLSGVSIYLSFCSVTLNLSIRFGNLIFANNFWTTACIDANPKPFRPFRDINCPDTIDNYTSFKWIWHLSLYLVRLPGCGACRRTVQPWTTTSSVARCVITTRKESCRRYKTNPFSYSACTLIQCL